MKIKLLIIEDKINMACCKKVLKHDDVENWCSSLAKYMGIPIEVSWWRNYRLYS